MNNHAWVELRMTPLQVEEQPDGSIDVYVSELSEKVATEEAPHACWFCFIPLNPETFNTECLKDPREG